MGHSGIRRDCCDRLVACVESRGPTVLAGRDPAGFRNVSRPPHHSRPQRAQPTADQRLEELEKEVILLQQQIASLKSDSTPGMKTAAYAVPGSAAGRGRFYARLHG